MTFTPPPLSANLPQTPDFDSYPCDHGITQVEYSKSIISLTWSDGQASRFHSCWLADNDAAPLITNSLTREREIDFHQMPENVNIESAWLGNDGNLHIQWAADREDSRYLAGWLRAHDYSNTPWPDDGLPARTTWSAQTVSEPPTTDGTNILESDAVLSKWLNDLAEFGLARLSNVSTDDGMVAKVVRRIGPIRESNFGFTYDVKMKANPDSNAYTSMALNSHTDLATREYQPGLQFLHCLRNSTEGGAGTMVDGFRVAEDILREEPEVFKILSSWNWAFTNRAEDTDYRWTTPLFVHDADGDLSELRLTSFLRGPLAMPFDQVEAAYDAYKNLVDRVARDEYRLRFDYRPGDLVAYDNRRILHGREAFTASVGERWLQGCYSERDELRSRLRILARNRRAEVIRQIQQ
jgi:gamma-butyrobetaine dioxygenase